MTAEDDWFNEHPHGRDGLGPAPESTVRAWLADHFRRPFFGSGDGADSPRPNVTYRTRSEYMTAGELKGALGFADDSDRCEVVGRELRLYRQQD